MAASLVRCRANCKLPGLAWKPAWNLVQAHNYRSKNAIFVFLPETPPDTPETNPIMRHNELPQFAKLDRMNVVSGCAKLSLDFESTFFQHVKTLEDLKTPKTFETVFKPIEQTIAPMLYAWKTARTLALFDFKSIPPAVSQRIDSQLSRACNERSINETLYNSIKELDANRENLDPYQKQLVHFYLLEAKISGINVHGIPAGRFNHAHNEFSKERTKFINNVLRTKGLYSAQIWNFEYIKTIPPHVLKMMLADRADPRLGPWKVTLQDQVYDEFMKHCSSREHREKTWLARHNIAGHEFHSKDLSNSITLDRIRKARHEIAQKLGYNNYAEVCFEKKMARSAEAVHNMLEKYRTTFLPVASDEIDSLQDFANSKGFQSKLSAWDIPYWRTQQQKELYGVIGEEVAPYFPLPRVLEGAFEICNELFGITFKERDPKPELMRDNVMVYDIVDEDGSHLSTVYMDLFNRRNKQPEESCEPLRTRCDLTGTSPVSYLGMDIAPSILRSRPAILTFKEVKVLFHQIGLCLQQGLTEVPYCELSGQRKLEQDCLNMVGDFLECWLKVPAILQAMSGHHETGESLTEDAVHKLLQADRHMFAFDTCFELYLTALDLQLHEHDRTWWRDVALVQYEKFMPINCEKDDSYPCSFTDMVQDNVNYYSYLWSKMLAADVFETFKETDALSDKAERRALGKRFRETFLAMGGGIPAKEVFRKFRGRDPSHECLKHMYGLK